MKDSYVQAFIKSIQSGTEVASALTSLKSVLTRKGHLRLWSQILRAVVRELTVKLAGTEPQITLATSGSLSKEQLTTIIASLGSNAEANITIDPTLIGGYTARVGDQFVDASYKRHLVTLYRAIANGEK